NHIRFRRFNSFPDGLSGKVAGCVMAPACSIAGPVATLYATSKMRLRPGSRATTAGAVLR
ncbi:hypothetical protein, partial [Falsiroseomonas sp. E2-1-a4]|uniref:hypothetical protein n=1 Tax=Falsiroseomonas sp. E2-1-a4 TaxID=3239299 RepID=UPI003F2D92C3